MRMHIQIKTTINSVYAQVLYKEFEVYAREIYNSVYNFQPKN